MHEHRSNNITTAVNTTLKLNQTRKKIYSFKKVKSQKVYFLIFHFFIYKD